MNEIHVRLSTVRFLVQSGDDGGWREMTISEPLRHQVAYLLGSDSEARVSAGDFTRPHAKALVIRAGARLDYAVQCADAFRREVERGGSGRHEGPRNGIVFAMGEGEDAHWFYVYQTATQIVVSQDRRGA